MGSEAKWTPGPWTIQGKKALGACGVWTANADPRNPGHDGAGYQVQICSMNPTDRVTPIGREERAANARLIAAAPALHEALRKTIAALADDGCDHHCCCKCARCRAIDDGGTALDLAERGGEWWASLD